MSSKSIVVDKLAITFIWKILKHVWFILSLILPEFEHINQFLNILVALQSENDLVSYQSCVQLKHIQGYLYYPPSWKHKYALNVKFIFFGFGAKNWLYFPQEKNSCYWTITLTNCQTNGFPLFFSLHI